MRAGWTGAVLAVLVAVGCGGPRGPATYPAKGKVVYADGQPMTGGVVQFQPEKDAGASILADVGKDGTFSLYTLFDGKKTTGAVAGSYRILAIPPLGADQAVHPVQLPDLYTVQSDGGNDFTLTIPRPR